MRMGIALVPSLPGSCSYPKGVKILAFDPIVRTPLLAIQPANRAPAQATSLPMDCLRTIAKKPKQ